MGIRQLPSHAGNACLVPPLPPTTPPNGHKTTKYKFSELYYRSRGVGVCFRGTKGQVEGGRVHFRAAYL